MITITGASGQLGQELTKALEQRVSPSSVRLGTRNLAKIATALASGFQTAVVDFDDVDGMKRGFDGSDVVFIICGDTPNEVRKLQHRRAIDAAKAANVGRVVYTSFVNPRKESLFPFAAVHEDSESYLKSSGMSYTLLRNNHYMENLSKALEVARATGILSLPGAYGKVAYICRADVAAATANVLTSAGHDKISYELTGSAALDLFEVAKVATYAWETPIAVRDMDPDGYREVLAKRGLPPFAIDAQVGIRMAAGAGEYSVVTPHATVLAGRPLISFADYLTS